MVSLLKASVTDLMTNLLSKSPNYIRCIKVSVLIQTTYGV